MTKIEIYRKHEKTAYGVYCEKRFRAFGIQKSGGIYSGDPDSMEILCEELRAKRVVFMPKMIEGRKIVLL